MDEDIYDYLEEQRLKYEKWVREKSIKLELGKTYLQVPYEWAKAHYKIVSIDGNVAMGKKVYCGIYNSTTRGCGGYELFRVDTGEKYQEPRLNYALICEV